MSDYDSAFLLSPEAARALVAGARRECPGCGKPLQGRQKTACSGRCRAKLSRQHRVQEVRECLLAARQAIDLALEMIPE
jgi:predicted nucleic acid-binding Zn ribbon protein